MTSHAPRRMTRSLVLLAVSAAVSVGCDDAPPTDQKASGTPPNVLLISVDTLRPDHLGAYGYAKNTSPRIDRLAAEGALFETAISSSSWTLPAHAALFTGLSDSVHGCDDSDRRLDESRLTLAEVFKENGYRTVGFFAGPFLHPAFGLAQGFDRYVDCSSYSDASRRAVIRKQNLDNPAIVDASHQDVTNPRVVAQFKKWLEKKSTEPFFMFVHLWDVHFDFVPPPPYDTMFDPGYQGDINGEDFFRNPRVNPKMSRADFDHILALYDGEIAWTDHHIGLMLDDLDGRGLLDNTIVALVSDHGEEFFEHGQKGHRFTLYDEVIRIPMILWYPEKIAPGTRVHDTTSIVDVFPTLLELAGLPARDQPMGRSLIGHLGPNASDGDAPPVPSRLAISELNTLGRDIATFRGVDKKLLLDNKTGRALTYDLRIDPLENLGTLVRKKIEPWERGLIKQTAALRTTLAERAEAFAVEDASPQISDALMEQLQVLGYIDEPASSEGPSEPVEGPPDDDDPY